MNKKVVFTILLISIVGIVLCAGGILYLSNENYKEIPINNDISKPEKEETKKELEKAKLNDDGTIYFPDKNLELAIKASMNISDENYKITKEDAEKIKDLYLEEAAITNIAGLEYFINLEKLNLMMNGITDLNPIKNLVYLKGLWLADNFIKDISIISNLKMLETLNIANNEVVDISPVINLEHLSDPFLNGNPITNYDVLNNYVERMIKNEALILDLDEDYVEEEKESLLNLYKGNQLAVNEMKLWVENNINDNMSDLEKEYKIINFILDKYHYETVNNTSSYIDIYEMYNSGSIVCFGYSLLFQYLANFSGLESFRVYTNQSSVEIQEGYGNHVWNVVKIDGEYYQLDLTWADNYDEYDYGFINVSNSTMEELHYNKYPIYMLEIYPETKSDMNLNKQKKYWVDTTYGYIS